MTFAKLWGMFLDSPTFTELATRTQSDYRQHQKKLLAVFGKMKADDIKIEQVRIYMDKRGVSSKNRKSGSIQHVAGFGWGFERGYVKGNPCRGSVSSLSQIVTFIFQMKIIWLFTNAHE